MAINEFDNPGDFKEFLDRYIDNREDKEFDCDCEDDD
jgi:hypothetical protein